MSSCERCLFKSTYHDMGASSFVCTLCRDLRSAVKRIDEFSKTCNCPYAIYYSDLVDALADFISLPDDTKESYNYLWSKEIRATDQPIKLKIIKD